MARWFAWTILGATWLATILAFAGRWHWYADLFAHFRPQYAVSFSAIILVFLLGGYWRCTAVGVLGLLLNGAALVRHTGGSETTARPPSDGVLKCVSLNLLQGNADYTAVDAFLRSSGADVIVLQEVTPKWAVALEGLADVYPVRFVKAKKDSKGSAMLTRLNAKKLYFDPFPSDERVGALVGHLEGPAGPITVIGIHSHKPTSAKGAEAQVAYFAWLAERTDHASTPLVLMGDFNATPWSQAIHAFTSASPLLNADGGAIFDATWNRGWPNQLLIDHAFISRHWQLVKREVGPAVGSDHRPLVIDLALTL